MNACSDLFFFFRSHCTGLGTSHLCNTHFTQPTSSSFHSLKRLQHASVNLEGTTITKFQSKKRRRWCKIKICTYLLKPNINLFLQTRFNTNFKFFQQEQNWAQMLCSKIARKSSDFVFCKLGSFGLLGMKWWIFASN
jgi:hypothetical protein